MTSTKQFVGSEERNASGTMTRQFFKRGEIISGTAYFYVKDHLGSIRELTDSSGGIQTRYSFDLYGQTARLQGSVDADFQFAGMYIHARSGLYLTPVRQHKADLGVWLSRDLEDGISYNYASGNPLSLIDPLGLDSVSITKNDIPGHIGLLIQIGEGDTATYYRFDGAFTGIKIGNRNVLPVGTLISTRRVLSCKKPDVQIAYADLTKDEKLVRRVLDAAESIHNKVNAAKLSYTLIPYGATTNGGWPMPFITGTSWQYTSNQETGTILRSVGLDVPSSLFAPGANLNLPFGP